MVKQAVLAILVAAIFFAVPTEPDLFAEPPLQTSASDATGSQTASAEVRGRVIDADGKPVAGVRIEGYSFRNADKPIIDTTSDSSGNWRASRPEMPILVGAKRAGEMFAAFERLEPGSAELTLRLRPSTTAHGKLVDERGRPAAQKRLSCTPVPFVSAFANEATTDDRGEFTLNCLAPDHQYFLNFVWDNGDHSTIQIIEPKRLETLKLATVTTPPPPLSPNERAAILFNQVKDLPERIEQALQFDTPQSIRLLIAVGDPQSEAVGRYIKSFTHSDYPAYDVMSVSTENDAAMSFLREKYGLEISQLKPLTLLVFSSDNKVLASKHLPWTMSQKEDELNAAVEKFLAANALPRPDAKELLAAAFAQARREGKCVLLDETGTYCGWCRILSRFFDRHPDIFANHFVLVQIDRHRSPHGYEALALYRPSGEGGVPWCALIDADGKKLGDWDTADGNMGYPTLPKDFDHVERILKLAAPKITDEQLSEMRADLEQEAKKYEQH